MADSISLPDDLGTDPNAGGEPNTTTPDPATGNPPAAERSMTLAEWQAMENGVRSTLEAQYRQAPAPATSATPPAPVIPEVDSDLIDTDPKEYHRQMEARTQAIVQAAVTGVYANIAPVILDAGANRAVKMLDTKNELDANGQDYLRRFMTENGLTDPSKMTDSQKDFVLRASKDFQRERKGAGAPPAGGGRAPQGAERPHGMPATQITPAERDLYADYIRDNGEAAFLKIKATL